MRKQEESSEPVDGLNCAYKYYKTQLQNVVLLSILVEVEN